jgi:excisionase family DNA binding protein
VTPAVKAPRAPAPATTKPTAESRVSVESAPATANPPQGGSSVTDRLAYRVWEAATLVGVSRSKMYELVAAGEVPTMRIGSAVRIPAEALRAWVARHTTKAE